MERVIIEIKTTGAMFEEGNENYELIRLLEGVVSDLKNDNFREKKLMDLNGNKVGFVTIEE